MKVLPSSTGRVTFQVSEFFLCDHLTQGATNSITNCWGITRTSQYRTYTDAKLRPKMLLCLPAFGEGGRSSLCLDCVCVGLMAFHFHAVSMEKSWVRWTYCLASPHPPEKMFWFQPWGSSCYLHTNMSQYFPLFSYVKWREHFREMLTAERGRWFWEAGWQAQPLQWLERSRTRQKAVSEMQAEQKWQWRGGYRLQGCVV